MNEASLASLPGNSLPGLDMGQVERERKDMWSRMFQKYEAMEESEEMSEEINLEDIDKPETVDKIFKDRLQSQFVQPSSVVKQYLREHADEMDEIATIAGPPGSDEDVISDDSEDELGYRSENDADNDADAVNAAVVMNHMPLTPASSDTNDENGNANSSDEVSELEDIDATNSDFDDEDNNDTLVGLDDDGDMYSAAPIPESKNLFDNNHNPHSFQEPNNKKPRFKSPPRSCNDQAGGEERLMISQVEQTSEECDRKVNKPHIVCCQCLTSTLYYALPVRDQLVCDECLAGDHVDCEVEECKVCREVGEVISLRRQAEVFGRVNQRKLELSSIGLNGKTVECDEDETDSPSLVEESLRKPCDKLSPLILAEDAVDTKTICDSDGDEGAELAIEIKQSRRSTSSPGGNAGGLEFLPPLGQCAKGQYPSSLVSHLPHHKYILNKVYPRPGCNSVITLYYCCSKKSQGCKGKCKVKLDQENKVELVDFSSPEHNHH